MRYAVERVERFSEARGAARRGASLSWVLLATLLGCEESTSEDAGGSLVDATQPVVSSEAGGPPDSSSSPVDEEAGTTWLDAGVMHGLDAAALDAGDGGSLVSSDGSMSADAGPGDATLAPDGTTPPHDAAVAVSWPKLEAAQLRTPKLVASGYTLSESPLWDHCEHKLLFTDVSANVILQLGQNGKVTPFMTDTHYTNGMAFDRRDGSLVLAQMGGGAGGRLARRTRAGKLTVLVDKDPYGRLLHTVDDVAVRSDGTIYFSDGDFPHGPYLGFTLLSDLPLYILKPGGALVEGYAVRGPNGVELSADEKTLYLSSYFGDEIVKLNVAADGSLSRPTVFAAGLTSSDSFCLDVAGNVYAGTAGGLDVLRPDGSRVTLIPINSGSGTTNCGFGGEDGRTLYITNWTDLLKIESMPIPGLDWTINQDVPCTQ